MRNGFLNRSKPVFQFLRRNTSGNSISGNCPRTLGHKHEILQSVCSSENLCLLTDDNDLFLGFQTSYLSIDTYKLKVENSKNRVFGKSVGIGLFHFSPIIYVCMKD